MSANVADSDPAPSELGAATLTSARWIFAARVVAEMLLLGSTVVLARLLRPTAFGHAAIALIFTSLATVVISGIAGPLLIQRPKLTSADCEATALLGCGLGLAVAIATFFGAPFVAQPLFGSQTAHLIQLASMGFLFVGVAAAPQALLQRRLAFRRLSEIEIVSTVAGTAASIVLAVAGAGASAIVAGTLAALGLASVGAVLSAPPVRPRWHPRELRDAARFGAMTASSSLAALTYSNIDYAILGAKLPAGLVGLYWRAYQLGAEYQGKISIVMLRLAFPVYARSANREQLVRMRRRIVRAHAGLIFPLLGILVATAPELIPFVYGSAWRGAVLPTQILASVGMMAAVLTGIGQLMFAIGELRRMVLLSWISVAVYATTIYFVSSLGITAVCIADAVLYFALLISSHYFLASKQAGIPLRSLWEEVGPALAAAGALLAVAAPLAALLHHAGAAAPLVVLIAALAGLTAYAVTLRKLSRAAWDDVQLLRARIGRRRAAKPEAVAA